MTYFSICVSTPPVAKNPFQGQTKAWLSGPGFFTFKVLIWFRLVQGRTTVFNGNRFFVDTFDMRLLN